MNKIIPLVLLLSTQTASACLTNFNNFNPSSPASSGFTLIFDDEFTSLSTIDTTNSRAPRFKWYLSKFLGDGNNPCPAGDLSQSGSVLTISTSTSTCATWEFSSAGSQAAAPYYVGTTFGSGKPLYFEGRFQAAWSSPGWAFWLEPIQHLISQPTGVPGGSFTSGADQWPRQTTGGQGVGYQHFVEDDMLELTGTNTQYKASLHDWYGIYNVTCGSYCQVANTSVIVPSPNWGIYHTIGQLWVPGVAANNYHGYVQNYFDNVAETRIAWDTPPSWSSVNPPPASPNTWSAMDGEQMVLIIGAATGTPLNVDWVHVWQFN